MRGFKRSQRLAEQIQRDVSEIVAELRRDRTDLMITISAVEVTQDLKQARVFYTVLGDAVDNTDRAREFFLRTGRQIQGEMAKRLHIRRLPELIFSYDHSLAEGMRLTTLIDEVTSKKSERDDNTADH